MNTLKFDKLRIKLWPIPRNNAKKYAEFLDSNNFTTKSARFAKYSKKWNTFLIYKQKELNVRWKNIALWLFRVVCFLHNFVFLKRESRRCHQVLRCKFLLSNCSLPPPVSGPGSKYTDQHWLVTADTEALARGGACTASAITKAQSGARGSRLMRAATDLHWEAADCEMSTS